MEDAALPLILQRSVYDPNVECELGIVLGLLDGEVEGVDRSW